MSDHHDNDHLCAKCFGTGRVRPMSNKVRTKKLGHVCRACFGTGLVYHFRATLKRHVAA